MTGEANSGEPRSPGREIPEDPVLVANGMTFADIAIRNHVFAWMLMAALMGFGIIAFRGAGGVVKGLGISQNPDVDSPVVNINVNYEGASPEVMETDVIDPLEDAMTSIEGVKEISSTSTFWVLNVLNRKNIARMMRTQSARFL